MQKLLTIDELSEVLHVSKSTVIRELTEGKLPHRRVRSRILFSEADVEQIIERAKRTPSRRIA